VKGKFWVTRGGDVVENVAPFKKPWSSRGSHLLAIKTAPCRRVGSGAYVGTRRLDKLRRATAAEVKAAREKWSKPRRHRAEDARARRRRAAL